MATRSSQKGKTVRMQVPGEDGLTHLGTEGDDEDIILADPKRPSVKQAVLINQSDELDQYDQIHKEERKHHKKSKKSSKRKKRHHSSEESNSQSSSEESQSDSGEESEHDHKTKKDKKAKK